MNLGILRGKIEKEDHTGKKTIVNVSYSSEDFFRDLPAGYSMVITGMPGTFKSSLCYNIARYSGFDPKDISYILIEQNERNFLEQLRSLDIENSAYNSIIKCVPFIDSNSTNPIQGLFREGIPIENYRDEIAKEIDNLLQEDANINPNRLLIVDSVSSLIDYCKWDVQTARQKIGALINVLRNENINSILISEKREDENFLTYMADVLVHVEEELSEENKTLYMSCSKFRGQKVSFQKYEMRWHNKKLFLI